MEIVFSADALEQLQYWKKSGNKKAIEKIKLLIEQIQITPFEGTGKPEALKHNWTGYWSRRITSEHRLVYKVENDTLFIAQLRFHY
ncbi:MULTISPECIES: Txe/YoeB family addiction module toxin [unclassified Mucilaginibacter]|uniref:Txe/YoeB family addiction module toxin n=1 Tax=unclassified Mucilaginibacter TaxID=2617802 RepID=UPI002AC8BA2B|nr:MULTISPECIES: Txe/YoeB family addiction module toxin [unclassified Mucilaginibacter]MEB0263372.1 Txe/YoeB family addiction module toxin [Mucilaginibacter sp. 10I4]MEB0279301.1 Txe/YoeB family addiction module toxin [Mucilaginibacter sp. 10B2]MEB0302915.1 Txe/YoeB family addiction module toxin [Mucilaginibacter sp. 5C4]WPX23187.1 Txe/YoeB family addiction module toxin [Mucilaginibacter sp. 5C4]